MKLRLLLFKDCNRHCKGCCNKQWDLDKLEVCKSYKGYSEIILTGGEPLLYPDVVRKAVHDIRRENNCPIYLYTAKTDNIGSLESFIFDTSINGLTITLHTKNDVLSFLQFDITYFLGDLDFSLRLNVFKGIKLDYNLLQNNWIIKKNIKWIKNCPLPKDEVFMRYDITR